MSPNSGQIFYDSLMNSPQDMKGSFILERFHKKIKKCFLHTPLWHLIYIPFAYFAKSQKNHRKCFLLLFFINPVIWG